MTDTSSTIRRVTGEELLATAYPLQDYAFGATPVAAAPQVDGWRRSLAYREDNVTLVSFTGAEASATAVGIPMRQHVRGRTLPMLGVSGVATHPAARRQGHVARLLTRLHGEMRDSGHVVSTLYPYRMSFYERAGYVGFPKPRSIRLFPDGLHRIRHAEVPGGELSLHRIGAAFDDYHRFIEQLLGERHGFSVPPRRSVTELRDSDSHWVILARQDDEVVGALLYRTNGFGHELQGSRFLSRGLAGRVLLLQWLGLHAEQYSAFTFELPPDGRPDLWYTDIRYTDETKIASPLHSAPMGRVLSVEGLAGISVGSSRVRVEVVDDPFVAGTWLLDGTTSELEVSSEPTRSGGAGSGSGAGSGPPTATLTSHGLAALVYGVLDPAEVALQGYGKIDTEAAQALRTLFPPATPYLFASF
ncbi:GNAT family N-acetyltransferase [Actinopolymorpha sp. B9G3]|uniref:GNAT family N-acetyltransferase n=1 Tax=Actinopolymorpha sp. B9G3 TaxID=3158970 RepID=UPI0032D92F20